MNSPAEISVVIPCYNQARFLYEAVSSVLHQVGVTLEVVIVDDGSTDDLLPTLKSLASADVRILRRPHAGAARARNIGIEVSHGEFLAFLDADDLWSSDRLERALGVLKASTNPTMSFARMQEFLDPTFADMDSPLPCVRTLPGISASGLVIHRRNFDQVGPFDTSLRTGEFIDWYLRADRLGFHTHVDECVLVHRRVHAANRDRQQREENSDYARIVMRNLRQRRNQA